MKKVACEICGGNLIKTGDLFECQSCGCSYTLDAVKKMVTGSSDDSNQAGTQAAQEKPKQANNTVSIDLEDENMKQFSNHLELAKAALQARDFNSVVASSEKALELKPDSYAAWFYKAVSIGWLSTLKDNKLPQLIVAAQKAVNYAPDSEKFQIGETIFHEGKQIVNILFARSNAVVWYFKNWLSLLEGIPYLSKELIEKEMKECARLYTESRDAIRPKKRILYANCHVSQDMKDPREVFERVLAPKIELAERQKKEIDEQTKENA